jgi:hypothetical protein
MKEKITILCSGVTLGIYVPALVVNNQLQERGFTTEIVVLEELFFSEKQKKIPDTKLAFHRNFAFALMGQRFTKGIHDNIDILKLQEMLDTWRNENRKRFLVFSGFWLPLVDQYLEQINFNDIMIDLCHMDATIAVSWRTCTIDKSCYRHIWLFNWDRKEISYFIDISNKKPLSFNERKNRIIIHGGGWGIGTYKDIIPKLAEQDIKLDVIAYEKDDLLNRVDSNKYFLIDPNWNAWERNVHGFYLFPPLGEVKDEIEIEYNNNKQFSEVYHIISRNKAIISKPGGATLIDSLSSATPIIFLDPFGKYETANSSLWEYFGFGISFDKWMESGFSFDLLKKMHMNLLNLRLKLENYLEIIINAA